MLGSGRESSHSDGITEQRNLQRTSATKSAQAGIDAAEQKVMEGLQRLLFEELHHRIKNVLATVMAIASQSLRHVDNVEQGREAIEHRLLALGRVYDLLLKNNWTSATLASIVRTAIDPFDKGARFFR